MDFIALDKTYQNPVWLLPINVQWYARFYECGEFCIQIPTSSYEDTFAYLYCSERKQTGIVQKVFQEETLEGKFTQISGFFLERLLHDHAIYETFHGTGNICQVAADIVTKYCASEDIIIKPWGSLGSDVDKQITGGYVDDALYDLLKTQNITFILSYEFEEDQMYLEFVKGVDRTQSQEVNNTITFSEELKNLSNVTYTGDSSNYKNFVYVAGEGQNSERIVVTVDRVKAGERRYELWVDARDIQKTDEITQEAYEAQLAQRGIEALADYVSIVNVSFDIDTSLVEYGEDFDLGDKTDCILVDMGLSYEAEVIEVNEVWKDNQHSVELVLGDKIPTKYDKLMKG